LDIDHSSMWTLIGMVVPLS